MSNHGITVDYINPFIEATTHTFQTRCSLAATRDRIFLKGDGEEVYGVSGIIGLGGEATGVVVLSFPELVAIRVVSKFAGEEFSSLTSGSGWFWYSAQNATSPCSLRFMACWSADISSWLKRASQATRAPASISARWAT